MKNQGLRWKFVNQSNPVETVIVHDQASAQTLAVLLQKMNEGEWIMQEERPLGSLGQVPQPQKEVEVESAEVDVDHEDQGLAQAVIEAAVHAHHAQQTAQQSKVVVPPPAPKKQEKRERRAQQRFMTEFRVILISGSSSFRTMSQDVSLGGMRLKKTVPASFMKEKCIAYVSHKDLRENIEIVCNVIGDPEDPCRIQFIQPNQTQLKRLNDWLVEHNSGAKKVAS